MGRVVDIDAAVEVLRVVVRGAGRCVEIVGMVIILHSNGGQGPVTLPLNFQPRVALYVVLRSKYLSGGVGVLSQGQG